MVRLAKHVFDVFTGASPSLRIEKRAPYAMREWRGLASRTIGLGMSFGARAVISFVLLAGCEKHAPGPDVDETARDAAPVPATSASASATHDEDAGVAPPNAPSFGPIIVVPGFPPCPHEPSFEELAAGPKRGRLRLVEHQIEDAGELGPLLGKCFKRFLHEPGRINVRVGIMESGAVCEVSMSGTVALPAQGITCVARTLHGYRFHETIRGAAIIFPFRSPPAERAD